MATAIPLQALIAPPSSAVELDVAPLDWADFSEDERADIEGSLADIASGKARLVPHAEVQEALAEMRRQQDR